MIKLKKKFLILISIVFLISGCDITYNLDIYNGKFSENIKIIENDKSKWNSNVSTTTAQELYNSYKAKPIPISSYSPMIPGTNEKLNDVLYYNVNDLTNQKRIGMEYNYDMTQSQFNDSYFVRYAYNRFLVATIKDNITISTGEKLKLFEQYNNLENVTINITTNHKVIKHNADKVDGDTYIWKVNRENADDKSLYFEVDEDAVAESESSDWLKVIGTIIIVMIIILVVGYFGYLYLKRRHQKSNEF